ncbi:MAG: hypothetical protein IKK33_10220 [Lachnospiraceae bacterium]|nr:hypothetical protein [Lachnospiraceae bacterium]
MKRICTIIVSAIIISVLLIASKLTLTPILMKNANFGMSHLKKMKQVDKLFVGSSMFRQGIHPEGFGTKAYLLSYNGNQPYAEYLEVKELLESGVEIGTLYVDMYAYSMTAEVALSDTRIFQDVPPSFILALYEILREEGNADCGDLAEMLIKSNNEVFFTWPVSFPLINSRYQNGGNLGRTGGSSAEVLDEMSVEFTDTTDLNEIQCDYMEKLIKLCLDNQTEIVFVETPKYEKVYNEGNYLEIMKKYLQFLEQNQCMVVISDQTAKICDSEKMECVRVYSFDSQNPAMFMDLIHLSYDGRVQFSKLLEGMF